MIQNQIIGNAEKHNHFAIPVDDRIEQCTKTCHLVCFSGQLSVEHIKNTGQMVYAFNEAVYNTRIGDITLVETPFGFHIIKVTGKKEPVKKVRVGIINREVVASNETYIGAISFKGLSTKSRSFICGCGIFRFRLFISRLL